MRILCLANNWTGWKILHWLKEQGETVVGIVVHPTDARKYGGEIIEAAGIDPSCVFDASHLRQTETMEAIRRLRPDLGISGFFGYILRREFLELFAAGCVNVHPSLLPYNRGVGTNIWSIVDGTPAGVTIHYMDAGIDTGDVIAQREVSTGPTDTGQTLYRRLEHASVDLFTETWPLIRSGRASRIPQDNGVGTYHSAGDCDRISEIDLDQRCTARELINVMRALTFPPYPAAYFWSGGQKVYVRLQLYREEEVACGGSLE